MGSAPFGQRVAELGRRSGGTFRERLGRVRGNAGLALQTGVAAGIAWLIANDLLHHQTPFFAPIAAVITLAVSVGQRLRRAFELVIGVALGIAVGDALILLIGTGPWQIGLSVGLAVVSAIFLGGGSSLVVQASSSAVLVATLTPPTEGIYLGRFWDALIGGAVGLAVMALLLPINPLTVVIRAANPALDVLADGLRHAAGALVAGEPESAAEALERLRAAESDLSTMDEAIKAGRENATLAPVRWRARAPLAQYLDSARYVAHALRNSRVLVRRIVTMLNDGEPVPRTLAPAVVALGEAVELLRTELELGVEPEAARGRALRAVSDAGRAYADGVGFSGSVVVAQVRSTATDLVRASGVEHEEAIRQVRRAFGRPFETKTAA
ncbi:FUSC family protein [Catenuloplanes atrovinosus]|uniref:Uncharacterized membrane protein YgaE (UPF0421/DUF939 family) n=1 Tax=Catenuloplanes atrovinosus TaxID=137266 RepID=A0AAE3YY76_9ACTN|nr:FUSC family protein [Catenuloplanes atrovinosus]MDR7280404.1 uncharacterized membrane protein YgaE (UPF0421/DUF939 family) [Catenuloplanes atrovinosus]